MSECTACAASNMAIGDALDAIRHRPRRRDVRGRHARRRSPRSAIAGFDAMRALSRRNDDPRAPRGPFDRERDGLVMGEAGAVLVLEELEHARARGARIYAELVGYGVSADAPHMTEPDPTGASPARAMTMALEDAGVDPTEVGYVNAHATSTPLGDSCGDTGDQAARSARSMRGGTPCRRRRARQATASARPARSRRCSACAPSPTVLRRRRSTTTSRIPTAISTTSRTSARELPDLRVAMSNSFGFGGHNASIVVRRFED